MEESPVEIFTLDDASKATNNQNDRKDKNSNNNEGNDTIVGVDERENGPSLADGGEIPVGTVPEASTSPSSNEENPNQADIARDTPPPDYIGDEESRNIPGVPNNGTITAESPKSREVVASPDNFWLVGNYKKVVKKIEDGAKLCDDLSQMMLERAEMESLYAKKLKAWNKKWNQAFSKELEYGTVQQSLLKGLSESEEIADMHLAVHGKISEVSSQVLKWKSDTYHKGIMGIKEAKKAEERFSKAQKPWAKKYDDTIRGRQNYHAACQMLDSVKGQEEELKAAMDTTTQEQLTKIQNKVKKAEQDREASLEFYKDSLRDIEGYNEKYKGDMVYEYDKWESSEGKRKDFVIEKMKHFKECVDFSQFDSRIERVYAKMSEDYADAKTINDVEFFRNHFGPNMPFIQIAFVEYSPEIYAASQAKGKEQSKLPETNSSKKPREKSRVCVAI